MTRQQETIDQYRRSDENNLKAIESLEASIWEATDSKQQLLSQISERETQLEQLQAQLQLAEGCA